MDGIVPGIDVPDCPAVIRHIPGWTEEHSTHMHQFAEWEIRKQHTDQKQMDVKDNTDTFGDVGLKLTNPIASSFTPTICTLTKYLIRMPEAAMPRMRKRGK